MRDKHKACASEIFAGRIRLRRVKKKSCRTSHRFPAKLRFCAKRSPNLISGIRFLPNRSAKVFERNCRRRNYCHTNYTAAVAVPAETSAKHNCPAAADKFAAGFDSVDNFDSIDSFVDCFAVRLADNNSADYFDKKADSRLTVHFVEWAAFDECACYSRE